MDRDPKTSSSSKWRLGENVVLRLLGCLSFDIFIMNNYFTSFRLLTHIGVTTFEQHVFSTNIGDANALSMGTNICKKKGTWPL